MCSNGELTLEQFSLERSTETNLTTRQIWRACPDESRQAIQQAWEDSKRYGEAMAKWVPKGDYQPAMDMYMGDRSTFQSIGDPAFDFPKQIQGAQMIPIHKKRESLRRDAYILPDRYDATIQRSLRWKVRIRPCVSLGLLQRGLVLVQALYRGQYVSYIAHCSEVQYANTR